MQAVVIYLHGFLSSPQSVKAQQTREFAAKHYPQLHLEVPQLPNYPQAAAAVLDTLVQKHRGKTLRFIGSSMGGFLSTYLVEKYGGKGVLINPAVKPYELLADYLGEHVNPYTDEAFTLEEQHIEQLRRLDISLPTDQERYWVLLQTGDETLDYREAMEKYAQARLTVEQGGDHSFVDFDRHLPEIFRFLLESLH